MLTIANYSEFPFHPEFTVFAGLSIAIMLLFVYSRVRIVGFISWFLYGIAWLFNIPHFLSIGDYFNTGVMISAFIVFTLIAIAILKTERLQVFIDTTAFSALASIVYFAFAFTVLGKYLIYTVAAQTAAFGKLLGFNMIAVGRRIYMNGKHVSLILACTGIQSMALFTGATFGVKAELKRKVKAFLVSVPVIYFLNILRDVFVTASYAESWFGKNSFYIAHNVIAKILATAALFAIAYAVFKFLPELEELIFSLMEEIGKLLRLKI